MKQKYRARWRYKGSHVWDSETFRAEAELVEKMRDVVVHVFKDGLNGHIRFKNTHINVSELVAIEIVKVKGLFR